MSAYKRKKSILSADFHVAALHFLAFSGVHLGGGGGGGGGSSLHMSGFQPKKKLKRVFRSKYICGFSDHIKDILPQKRGLPLFPALARSLHVVHGRCMIDLPCAMAAGVDFRLKPISQYIAILHAMRRDR